MSMPIIPTRVQNKEDNCWIYLMVGTQKPTKTFKKYYCLPISVSAKDSTNTIFSGKMLVFLLQILICNYLLAGQYTVEKNSLNGGERHVIFQFIFIVDEVVSLPTKYYTCFATCREVKNG